MNKAFEAKAQQSTALPVPDFGVLFEAAHTPQLVVLPDDPVFTIIAANAAYERVCGLSNGEFLGRGVFEVFNEDPDAPEFSGVESRRNSFRRAIACRAPDRLRVQRYDVERSRADGGGFEERYWSTLNVPILGDDGEVQYVLHSVEEVTDRVRAEKKAHLLSRSLQTSETRFRQLAETSPFGLVIGDLEGNISYLNPTMQKLLLYSQEDVKKGLVHWDNLTPPEFESLDTEAVQRLMASGRCAPYEKEYLAKDSRRVPILVGASLLESVDGRKEMAAFILDLTERKVAERRDAFLVRLDDATRGLLEPDKIMEVVTRLLGEHMGADRCGYLTCEADQDTVTVARDYTRPEIPSIVGRYSLSQFGVEAVRLFRANLPQVVDDIESDPGMADGRATFRQVKIRAHASVPLHKAGRLVAAIGVHQQTPRKWLPEEVDLVRIVANRCWESIERAHITGVLQESESRLRLAHRAGRTGSFEWLIKENRIIWTPELEALYGVPEGTFEGNLSGWKNRVMSEDGERVLTEIGISLQNGQAEYAFEFRAVLPGGTLRWLRGHTQFFYDESGAPERMIGVNIDIDAQKLAEANLTEQWHTFDTALSNTPDLTYTFDLQGRFTYGNRALLAVFQRTLEEVIGKNFIELGYPPELAEHNRQQVQQVIETRQAVRDSTPFSGPSGETRHYEYIFVPVLGVDGQVEGVAGSTRDITEQRRVEDELRRTNRELEEFAYVASHDLQEPLRTVNINTQLILKHRGGSEAKLSEYADYVQQGVKRMEALIQDLLTFSLTVNNFEVITATADLSAALEETMFVLKNRIEETGAVITSPAMPMVLGETKQMAQVFQNLLANSLKYRKNNVRPEIRISVNPNGPQWVISVEDNGIGFEPKYAERIFGLFKRLHKDEYPGTGLGLAICQRIVERSGGRIWAEGRPGEGAVFRFSLPRVEEQ